LPQNITDILPCQLDCSAYHMIMKTRLFSILKRLKFHKNLHPTMDDLNSETPGDSKTAFSTLGEMF